MKYDFNPTPPSENYTHNLYLNPPRNLENLRYPGTVRYYNNKSKGNVGFHPNQKPVQLLEYLIQTYSKKGDTVLDFTMGSGSTGVACQNTGRDFIGIELEEKYYTIAKDRLRENGVQEKLV